MRLGFSRKECNVLNNGKELIYFSDYVKSRGINYMAAGVAALGFLFFMINPNITSIIANFVSVDNLPKASYYGNICIVWLEFIAYAVYVTYGFNKCTFREHEYLYCMKAGIAIHKARKAIIIFRIFYVIILFGSYPVFKLSDLLFVDKSIYYISYSFKDREWYDLITSIFAFINSTSIYILYKLKHLKGSMNNE